MFALIRKAQQLKQVAQVHRLQKLDGNGEPELDSYLAMPGNTSDGDLWNPPDTETCCAIAYDTTPA